MGWLAGAPETASEMSRHPGDDHLFHHAMRKDKIDVDLCQDKISSIVEIISTKPIKYFDLCKSNHSD